MDRKKKLVIGELGKSKKSQYFPLEEFDPDLASGYAKLVKIDKSLGIQVIDTYGNETKEKEEDFFIKRLYSFLTLKAMEQTVEVIDPKHELF